MIDEHQYDCTLCGLDFFGATCHSACPLSGDCAMVRCPRCGYEFVQEGSIVAMLRRFSAPWRKHDPPGHR